ncbi:hypothetical protein [Enterococcus sp. DIV0660C]|uniref:hypothetical protein n=1 Tax=Enterococcus sp. DIV0660C TaxID=2230880 RepID=UPI001A8C2B73|nr:hypothetical protein [Enterococcus sp. DIV0660C]MBO0430828.1 hypothetical protein [Enterococcus sp. DIV0660C]
MNENWQEIKQQLTEKEWLTDGYYRLRKQGEYYEFAFLQPGACGDFMYHPQITVQEIANEPVPIKYFDNGSSPVQAFVSDERNQQQLNGLFEQLMQTYLEEKRGN